MISLANCNTLAVDEADKMIEMNFGEDIRFLMNLLPKNRHTMMLSATMNPSVTELSTSSFGISSVVSVGATHLIPSNIHQEVFMVKEEEKIDLFIYFSELISNLDIQKVLSAHPCVCQHKISC